VIAEPELRVPERKKRGRIPVFFLLTAATVASAYGQQKPPDYPSRPIRIIAGVAPGGGLDTVTRASAQILSERMGQTVVVDNRPGGGTVLAMDLVAQAAPDGYTLLGATDTVLLVGAAGRVKYDVRKAYAPIVQMTTQSYMLVITPTLPIKTVKELIAYAKAKPDALTYGSSGIGTTSHLGLERFDYMAGTRMLHVPYKGAAPAMLDIIAGQIHMVLASTISATPHIKSGRLRVLATTGLKRVQAWPDLPTVSEAGVPGLKVTNSYALHAPAGTPRAILVAINESVSQGMNSPEMMKRLAADGSEPAERGTPEQFHAMIVREYDETVKLIKALNLKLY
jgi:tripartite-type tricarboxylate transporter receptor subunit TctC